MRWIDEEGQAIATDLIDMSEIPVRSTAADAGVDLRVVYAGSSEWHTGQFQRHGVTVTIADSVVRRTIRGSPAVASAKASLSDVHMSSSHINA